MLGGDVEIPIRARPSPELKALSSCPTGVCMNATMLCGQGDDQGSTLATREVGVVNAPKLQVGDPTMSMASQ